MIVELTAHAEARGRDRMNLSRSSLQRTAQKALDHGLHHEQADGKLKRWAKNSIASQEHSSNHVRIMGHYAFLFYDSTLITILLVPKECRPKAKRIRARQDEE